MSFASWDNFSMVVMSTAEVLRLQFRLRIPHRLHISAFYLLCLLLFPGGATQSLPFSGRLSECAARMRLTAASKFGALEGHSAPHTEPQRQAGAAAAGRGGRNHGSIEVSPWNFNITKGALLRACVQSLPRLPLRSSKYPTSLSYYS